MVERLAQALLTALCITWILGVLTVVHEVLI